MSIMKSFTGTNARSLPIFLLADVSGSMSGNGKIEAMNQAVRDMLTTFADDAELKEVIRVCVITFGNTARIHTELKPAKDIQWEDMRAEGGTPMGQAMEMAAGLIEDRNVVSSAAYRPMVILVTDGEPTDEWQKGLDRLARQGRAQKAQRFALAIGAGANENMLQTFLGDPKAKVFHAEDARGIKEFFDLCTMSAETRTKSGDPNKVVVPMGDPFRVKDC